MISGKGKRRKEKRTNLGLHNDYVNCVQVKGAYRNDILIPESGWESFRNVLDEYVKQFKE